MSILPILNYFVYIILDIVFCRTWYKVDVPKFYCPVTTLLLAPGEKNAWHGVRTTGEIKRDKQVKNVANPDSLYTVSSTLNTVHLHFKIYYLICFKYVINYF